MDIKDFSASLKAKQKELDTLMRRELPIKVGRIAKDHYQDNFRKGGFVNGGLKRWPQTKRQSSGSKSAAAGYSPLLSRRNHLFSSVKYTPGDYRVRVANDVEYAPLHNWGGETHPTVTPRMRKFAWAMYYKAVGKRKKGKTRQGELPPEAGMWKGLALTRKKKLKVKIPQRQFIGESTELNKQIRQTVEAEIRNILK
ncbi:phage virion morphogenesis protein [Parabacteroides distasonis]|jgi:phage gpG-like protein|uniref:phage virion morphogenesis protein n=1 Tax=Parabacteroides distasonis TaxID=823 RepID=UPI00216588CA|nr:phage virion morphogenesis protein [Parabacteroides distasonis]MCS2606902.1 phage virion morphogenesis protein [Parabacteroides distasonis]